MIFSTKITTKSHIHTNVFQVLYCTARTASTQYSHSDNESTQSPFKRKRKRCVEFELT